MPSSTVNCDNCGAPLQIESGTRFVTCSHCQSSLRVEHTTDGATFTRKLEELKARVEKQEEGVEVLRLRKELERLNNAWVRVQQQRMLNPTRLPWPAAIIIAGVGLFVTMMAISNGFTVPFAFVGLAITVGAISAGVYTQLNSKRPDRVYEAYHRDRTQIEEQLRAAEDRRHEG